MEMFLIKLLVPIPFLINTVQIMDVFKQLLTSMEGSDTDNKALFLNEERFRGRKDSWIKVCG